MTQPPQPPDPYQRYRAEPIEKDKQEKTPWDKPPPPKPPSNLGANLLSFLRKLLSWFSSRDLPALDHLRSLHRLLANLQQQDLSQDTPFLNALQYTWHQILDDTLHLNRSTPIAQHTLALIKTIENYPQPTEHSLGYYLLEYKGQSWLPFPFMELLHDLHTDHQHNPTTGHLTRWTHDLAALIAEIESTP